MWIEVTDEKTKMAPIITVITPCYRAARFIGETLESLAAQTFADWELIAVEDGVADGTQELIHAFAGRVSQPVRYLRHGENHGLPAARNTALNKARGCWMALLDADDIWLPSHLESCVARAGQEQSDMVFAGSVLFDSESGLDIEFRVPSPESLKGLPLSLFLNEFIIQPSAFLFTRATYERSGGFDASLRYVEDLDFYFRALRMGLRLSYTGEISCRYRKHEQAMSAKALPMAAYMAEVYDRQAKWDTIPRAVRRQRIGSAFKSAGRLAFRDYPLEAAHLFWRGWRANPPDFWLVPYALWSLLRSASGRTLRHRVASRPELPARKWGIFPTAGKQT